MNMVCEKCRGPIGRQIGRGGRRRFCETCRPTRVRVDRPVPRSVARQVRPVRLPSGADVTGVEDATRRELEAAGVPLNAVGAVCALLLARAIDRDDDTVAGLIACVREHAACMEWAMQAAPQPEEVPLLEELRRQHRDRGAGR